MVWACKIELRRKRKTPIALCVCADLVVLERFIEFENAKGYSGRLLRIVAGTKSGFDVGVGP